MKLQEETKYKQWRNIKKRIDYIKRLIIELEKQSEVEVETELERLRKEYDKLIKQEESIIRNIVRNKLDGLYEEEDLWDWK